MVILLQKFLLIQEAKEEHTRIIIKEAGIGQDLKDYFVDAKIEMDDGSFARWYRY